MYMYRYISTTLLYSSTLVDHLHVYVDRERAREKERKRGREREREKETERERERERNRERERDRERGSELDRETLQVSGGEQSCLRICVVSNHYVTNTTHALAGWSARW